MPIHNVSVTTNATQEKGLQRLLARTNAERAARTPPESPFVDVPTLLTFLLASAVGDYVQQHRRETREALQAGLDNATGAQLTNVAAALGVMLPT